MFVEFVKEKGVFCFLSCFWVRKIKGVFQGKIAPTTMFCEGLLKKYLHGVFVMPLSVRNTQLAWRCVSKRNEFS